MIAAIVCLLLARPFSPGLAFQDPTSPQAPKKIEGPVQVPPLPPGVSPDFSARIYEVEDRMVAKQWDKALALLKGLPTREIKIAWADSKVPRSLRFDIAARRDAAFNVVRHGIEMSFNFVDDPSQADILFTFEPELAVDPSSGEYRAVATFFHTGPHEVPLEAVIGIKRGKDRHLATANEVQNDLTYVLDQYLGVARNQMTASVMSRSDGPVPQLLMSNVNEWRVTEANLEVVKELRVLAEKRKEVLAGKPDAFINPEALKPLEPKVQGKPFEFEIQITNRGTSVLQTRLIPDCGCFSINKPINVAAGDTAIYPVHMDTTEYAGVVHKVLYLYTNDPVRPYMPIPVTVTVHPRYRFLFPNGKIMVVNGEAGSLDAYLAFDGPVNLKSLRVTGASGEVFFEPWKGSLPDPELGQPSAPKAGFHLTINLGSNVLPGRQPFGLEVDTDDPDFPTLRTTLFVQKGIASLPDQVFFGNLVAPAVANVTLSRPCKPFRILKATCSNPHFVAKFSETGAANDHKLVLRYDGAGRVGDFTEFVLVRTNDPKQPTIRVPVTGTIH